MSTCIFSLDASLLLNWQIRQPDNAGASQSAAVYVLPLNRLAADASGSSSDLNLILISIKNFAHNLRLPSNAPLLTLLLPPLLLLIQLMANHSNKRISCQVRNRQREQKIRAGSQFNILSPLLGSILNYRCSLYLLQPSSISYISRHIVVCSRQT